MADPANAMNWARLAQLQALADQLDAELRRLVAEWETLAG
jgi:hypothetical protein